MEPKFSRVKNQIKVFLLWWYPCKSLFLWVLKGIYVISEWRFSTWFDCTFSSPGSAASSYKPNAHAYWPGVVFGPGRTWQDRPWPVLFMLAHGNAIWLVWMITKATAGWPAASRNQGHSTSALRTFPALFPSACRWIIHPVQHGRHKTTAQTLKKTLKTAHSVCWYNNL